MGLCRLGPHLRPHLVGGSRARDGAGFTRIRWVVPLRLDGETDDGSPPIEFTSP